MDKELISFLNSNKTLKTPLIAYKAFNEDWTSSEGFQYEIGKTYKITNSHEIQCCENGFHACFNPLSVLKYYNPLKSKFALVEISGQFDFDCNLNKSIIEKIATSEIKIIKELTFDELINEAISSSENNNIIQCDENETDLLFNKNESYKNYIIDTYGTNIYLSNSTFNTTILNGFSNNIILNNDIDNTIINGKKNIITSHGTFNDIYEKGEFNTINLLNHSNSIFSYGDYTTIINNGRFTKINSYGDNNIINSNGYSNQIYVNGKNTTVNTTGIHLYIQGTIGTKFIFGIYNNRKENKLIGIANITIDGHNLKEGITYFIHNHDDFYISDYKYGIKCDVNMEKIMF
jgi:hypothetical protein